MKLSRRESARRLVAVGFGLLLGFGGGVVRGASAEVASGSIGVDCGYLLVENHPKASFTVLLRSKDVHQIPVEGESMFVVDDVLIQVTTSSAAEVGLPSARGIDLLRRHQSWEVAYTKKEQRWTTLRASGDPIDLGLAKPAATMMWGYDAPTPIDVVGQKISRMLYLTAAIDDIVFVMAAPLRSGDDPGRVGSVLRKHMATLTREAGPVSLTAVSAAVKRGSWNGCGKVAKP